MKKLLKLISIVLAIIVLAIILLTVCLVIFVNPNRFKPMITAQVMKYTGRELVIDGNLSWTIFPSIGIKTGHMVLGNPSGFSQKTFAEIQSATVSVNVLPLLKSKIESSGIILEGVKLNLIRLANGHTNWDFQKTPTSEATLQEKTAEQTSFKKAPLAIAVSSIDISHADVSWMDQQNKQAMTVQHFAFHAKHINLVKPFPITAAFDFANKDPLVSGHTELSSHISVNLTEQVYSFRDIDLTTHINQKGVSFKTRLQGDVVVDLTQQMLNCTGLKGTLANLTLTGSMKVINLDKTPLTTGYLQIQPFDLKQLLQALGKDVSTVQTLRDVSGDVRFTLSGKSTSAESKVKIDNVEVNNVHLSHVIVPARFQNGILDVSSITADFYQGSLQARIKVNTNATLPQFDIQGKLANIQMGALLQDLGSANQKLKFNGMGNVDMQVTTAGTGGNAILKNLNGTVRMSVNNGALEGIDITYLLDSAASVVNGKVSANSGNSNRTPFSTMTGTAVIRNGVINNNDLLIASARFTTKGMGNINLVNQQINYRLQTEIKQADLNQKNNIFNLYGLAIPILIVGDLKSPSIRLDTEVLAKAFARQQLQKAQGKIEDQIKKNLPQAGEMLQNLLGR